MGRSAVPEADFIGQVRWMVDRGELFICIMADRLFTGVIVLLVSVSVALKIRHNIIS